MPPTRPPSWYDGTPAEALDAVGATGREEFASADAVRYWITGHREACAAGGVDLLQVAATSVDGRTLVVWEPTADLPDGTYTAGTVVPPERVAPITGWLADTWPATAEIRVLDDSGVLATVTDPDELAAARRETTTGWYDDVCLCLGDLTLQLHDATGRLLGSARLHGHGRIGWEPRRFDYHLAVADPAAIGLRLLGWGVPGQLRRFHDHLADTLGVVRTDLGPDVAPPPDGPLPAVLDWLGRLPVPMVALYNAGPGPGGEDGRRLLDAYGEDAIAAAVASAADPPPHRVLGAMNWARFQPDDRRLAAVLAPTLRRLLSAAPTRG